mgnify:CR=1 FL=1
MAKKKNYHECLTTPFKTGIRNFTSIANYFLYYAPNIDSAQSSGKVSEKRADVLIQSMIDQAGLKNRTKILKKIQPHSWNFCGLDKDILDFENSCFVIDKYGSESNFQALIRHLRNALAHGYIYVWKKEKGNYIFFADFDQKKKKFTAKILVSMKIMECWKALIENEIAIGE